MQRERTRERPRLAGQQVEVAIELGADLMLAREPLMTGDLVAVMPEADLTRADPCTDLAARVALGRAREQTDIHVSNELLADSEGTPLERPARRVGRSEPEISSIALPLQREPWLGAAREADDGAVNLEPEEQRTLDRDRGVGWEI